MASTVPVVQEGKLQQSISSRPNDDVHTRSVSFTSDSTMKSSVSDTSTTITSYSTKLAADVFAPPATTPVSTPYPYPPNYNPCSAPVVLPSSSNNQQQQQYLPPSLFNYNHHYHYPHGEQHPVHNACNQSTHDCTTNSYGGTHSMYEHQAVSVPNSNVNTNDGGGQQQHPYGYGPPPPPLYYNQQGTIDTGMVYNITNYFY